MSGKDLVGVKGWLLFLVIWLSILSVLGVFISYSQFWIAEIDYKHITTIRAYQNYKNIFFFIVIISIFIRIYAAYKLCFQHKESSVTFTKYILWITGPIASAMIAIFSLKLNYGPLLGENIKYTFINAIFALIWTLYLNKSKRVHNTYFNFINRHTACVNENELTQNVPLKESYLDTINKISQCNSEKQHVSTQDSVAMNKNEKNMSSNDLPINSDMINEDELYLQATKEVDEGNQDQALWAKCMALCEGDEGKAKYRYIKERVSRLLKEKEHEIEEKRKQEISRREEETRSISEVINKQIDFYLNPDNKEKLNSLLQLNKITYEHYRGSYKVILDAKNVVHFDAISFKDYLKKKLPTLNGF